MKSRISLHNKNPHVDKVLGTLEEVICRTANHVIGCALQEALKKDLHFKARWNEMEEDYAMQVNGFKVATETELALLERKFQKDVDRLLRDAREQAEELEASFSSKKRALLEEMSNESESTAKKHRVDDL